MKKNFVLAQIFKDKYLRIQKNFLIDTGPMLRRQRFLLLMKTGNFHDLTLIITKDILILMNLK